MGVRFLTDMLPSEEQRLKMSLTELELLLHGCVPDSNRWIVVWPVYESKRRRAESRRTFFFFGISTVIALAALIRSFFPAPQAADALRQPALKDPLSLFESNPDLENCLKKVNPADPLGLGTNDAAQDRQRQGCIAKYARGR